MENSVKSDGDIARIQFVNDKSIYYSINSTSGQIVYRTLDGGVSWAQWSYIDGYKSGFHAVLKDTGWINGFMGGKGYGLYKLPEGGG